MRLRQHAKSEFALGLALPEFALGVVLGSTIGFSLTSAIAAIWIAFR